MFLKSFGITLLIVFLFDKCVGQHTVIRWLESPRLTNWGQWGMKQLCPLGSWVSGMDLKVEANQGEGDDSALNAVKLICTDVSGNIRDEITSSSGPWGDYRGKKYCHNGFATGFQLRSEPSLGRRDDAAAIDLKLKCMDHDTGAVSEIIGSELLTFGDWTQEQKCPPETAICGIATQIESQQGEGDDSALNNIDLACCRIPYYFA